LSFFLQCLSGGSYFDASQQLLGGVTDIFSEVNATTSKYGIDFSAPYNTSGTLDQQMANILTAGQNAVTEIEQISVLNVTWVTVFCSNIIRLHLVLN
jgi:hypothetical protein